MAVCFLLFVTTAATVGLMWGAGGAMIQNSVSYSQSYIQVQTN